MTDEQQLQDLVAQWHSATRMGDTDAVLELMTDDVVLLAPGRPPMLKADFAALSTGPTDTPRPKFEIRQSIRELEVSGELAYMWTELEVAVTRPGATVPVIRSGYTLTVFKKVNGCWKLARDANLLTLRN